MKLSPKSLDILRNFSTINQSILFRPGQVQRTVSPQKNVFAEARLDEKFPVECAIYELPKFLAVLTLFEDPELTFHEQYLDITGAKCSNNIRYYYANSSLIVTPPDKTLELEEKTDSFSLDQETLSKLNKAALIMGVPHFIIERKDKERIIKTSHIKNKSSNVFTVTQKAEKGTPYTVVLSNDNLKYIPNNYNITVGKIKGSILVNFSSDDVTYWVATEV